MTAAGVTTALCAGVFMLSLLLTAAARRFALRRGLLDVPNERSSHSTPVPRTGGVGIVVATLAGVIALALSAIVDARFAVGFVGGGSLIAAVGLADDRRPLGAGIRLVTHFFAAGWFLYAAGGLPPLQAGQTPVDLGWIGHALALFGIVWAINLFNFMDGIDGIAASEAACVAGGAALIAAMLGIFPPSAACAAVLCAAALGFLPWNWSPAKIFMGDVGSGFLGFAIAALAVQASVDRPAGLFSWWILCGVFIADATVTLFRRLARGERPHVAHRSHSYQLLARRVGHARVTLGVILLNAGCLLPLAGFAAFRPDFAGWLALAALAPLFTMAAILGSGRREL